MERLSTQEWIRLSRAQMRGESRNFLWPLRMAQIQESMQVALCVRALEMVLYGFKS
jgi:hypothetical protein